MSSEAEEEEPHPKKLRFSDHDLTVVLEYTVTDADDVGGKGRLETKEHPMYSQKLASMSKFVDAALTVDMKEKETRLITFHGVTPKEFETALGYVESPAKVLTMSIRAALDVAPFYDQYDFTSGREICDEVLSAYIMKQTILNEDKKTGYSMEEIADPENITDPDLLVDVIAAAYKYELKKCLDEGTSYLQASLGVFPSVTMYTEAHLRMLHPLFKSRKLKPPFQLNAEEIESALYPKYFSLWIKQRYTPVYASILVNGAIPGADGSYKKVSDTCYQSQNRRHRIEKTSMHGRDWVITDANRSPMRSVFYRSPSSRNSFYPPKWPWIPVNGTGYPSITYIT